MLLYEGVVSSPKDTGFPALPNGEILLKEAEGGEVARADAV